MFDGLSKDCGKPSSKSKDLSFEDIQMSGNINRNKVSTNASDANCFAKMSPKEEQSNRLNTVIVNINFKSKRVMDNNDEEYERQTSNVSDNKLLNVWIIRF